MKTSRLAVPANSCGGSLCRVSVPASVIGNPFFDLKPSDWIRRAAAVGLLVTALSDPASAVNLAWNPNPESDIARYEVSYGTSPGSRALTVNAGRNTSASVTGLQQGVTYYFVVTATNQAGLQSEPSPEISYQEPGGSPPPPVDPPPSAGSEIPTNGWTLKYASSQETEDEDGGAVNAIDGNPNTYWISRWLTNSALPPHDLQIDTGISQSIQGFRYLPRQDSYNVGNIGQYEFYVSVDGENWGTPVAAGTFTNTKSEKEVLFPAKIGRYVQLRALTDLDAGSLNGGILCCVAELKLIEGAVNPPPVNQAPVAAAQSVTTSEDHAVAVKLSASDADGDSLEYSIVSGPGKGTLSGAPPNLTYTPVSDFSGADSFSFRASDGSAYSNVATISIAVDAGPPLANIGPSFVSDPIFMAVAEDQSLGGRLNASDPDETGTLKFAKLSGPSWLTVSAGGQLGGVPSNADVGVNTFRVRVIDSSDASATASLLVTVTNTNDAPVFTVNPISRPAGTEETSYSGASIADTAADADVGDVMSFSKVSGPEWLVISAEGELSGTPPAGSSGLNTFTVHATDKDGATGDAVLLIQISSSDLPLPWSAEDLAKTGLKPLATYESESFTLESSGGIGGSSDSGCYVWRSWSGDGMITARLTSTDGSDRGSLAGVMIRDSLASNSKHVFVGVDGSGGFCWQRRTSTGGSARTSTRGKVKSPDVWLALVRKGQRVSAYKSTNGYRWSRVASMTTGIGNNCYIGIAVGSGGNNSCSATFSEVNVRD